MKAPRHSGERQPGKLHAVKCRSAPLLLDTNQNENYRNDTYQNATNKNDIYQNDIIQKATNENDIYQYDIN